jgi:hypothetical protein
MTARDKDNKTYQTPYGSVQLERYVYQTSKGGKIYCPLEHNARIIRGATPKNAVNNSSVNPVRSKHSSVKWKNRPKK